MKYLVLAIIIIITLTGCTTAAAETQQATTTTVTIEPEQTSTAEATTTVVLETTTTTEEITTTAPTTTEEPIITTTTVKAPVVPTEEKTTAQTSTVPVQTTPAPITTAKEEEYKGFTEADCLYIISECEKYMNEKGYNYCNLIEGYNTGNPCLSYMKQELNSAQYGWLFKNSTWHSSYGNNFVRKHTKETIISGLIEEIDYQESTGEGTIILDYCSNKAYKQWCWDFEGTISNKDTREGLYTFIICVE